MRKITDAEMEVIAQKAVDDLIKKREHAKKLVSNDEYMRWLERFTEAYPNFCDDDWLYSPESLTEEDYNQVQELQYFFDGITQYALSNGINTKSIEYGFELFVKFNNIGYKIGIMSGQGTIMYVQRCEVPSEESFVDFNDCIANK